MKYNEVKKKVFASGTIPDGYFGKRASVDFALCDNTIITVADCGCFRAGLPDVQDTKEAMLVLDNHPSAKHITVTVGKAL